jgi:hypothetical protein
MADTTYYDMIKAHFKDPSKYPDEFEHERGLLNGSSVLNIPLTVQAFSDICEVHTRKTVELALNNMPSYRKIAEKYVNPDGSHSSPDAITEAIYKFAEDIKANAKLFQSSSLKEAK